MKKHIQAGTLNMEFSEGFSRLDELMAFASRENQKRGFLFVSKVLGKHIPVEPKTMRAIYDELAEKCVLKTGESVHSSLVWQKLRRVLVLVSPTAWRDKIPKLMFTTNIPLATTLISDIWFSLDEAHSHAVDHIMYQPPADLVSAPLEQTQKD